MLDLNELAYLVEIWFEEFEVPTGVSRDLLLDDLFDAIENIELKYSRTLADREIEAKEYETPLGIIRRIK